ncbi:hypothetical protein AURDEDRAFT_114635 [Auricularia subglabra TFB-10046 SS5]|nr:hypothetical protein AURDEDRAFT_114635 [Auricularia subglabra TFB-10046 SS5]
MAFKVLLLALSTAYSVLGAPATAKKATVVGGNGTVSADATRPVKLAGPGVFVTTEENWAGPSLHIVNVVKGQCNTFAAEWQNVISSFGPDLGLQCYGYQQVNCQPPHPNFGPFFTPGIFTHAAWDQDGINYDNRVNSFICYDGFPPPITSTGFPISTRTATATSISVRPTSTVGPPTGSSTVITPTFSSATSVKPTSPWG